MATRPGVRGGAATRGFPPGSAQALVAFVLGLVFGLTGLQRGDWALAVGFLLLAAVGAIGLYRVFRSARR